MKGRRIRCFDETGIKFGQRKSKVWQVTTIKSSQQALLSGLSTGLPSRKDSRLIIIHAGHHDGFIQYACEMNGESHEKWFKTKLLPNIHSSSVIVIDKLHITVFVMSTSQSHLQKKTDIDEWLSN